MARTNRSLFWSLVSAVVIAASIGAPRAQDKPPVQKSEPAAVRVAMPDANKIVLLIRTALLTLNDALRSGNFTVLRDVSAPAFREANTAARLGRIFTSLQEKKIDLSAVATMAPKLTEAPVLDKRRLLHIKGYFPGQPVRIDFNLIFQVVRGHWRLFGLTVNPVASPPTSEMTTPRNPPPKTTTPKK